MKFKKNNSGASMIIVLILVMVVVTAGTALLFSVNSEIAMNRRMEQRAVAVYMAQAGIEHAMTIIQNADKNSTPACPTGTFIVYKENQEIHQYKIMSLSRSAIISKGSLILNGKPASEVTINAVINNGEVSIAIE